MGGPDKEGSGRFIIWRGQGVPVSGIFWYLGVWMQARTRSEPSSVVEVPMAGLPTSFSTEPQRRAGRGSAQLADVCVCVEEQVFCRTGHGGLSSYAARSVSVCRGFGMVLRS